MPLSRAPVSRMARHSVGISATSEGCSWAPKGSAEPQRPLLHPAGLDKPSLGWLLGSWPAASEPRTKPDRNPPPTGGRLLPAAASGVPGPKSELGLIGKAGGRPGACWLEDISNGAAPPSPVLQTSGRISKSSVGWLPGATRGVAVMPLLPQRLGRLAACRV